ncbi:MAG: SUMF1/EgtB/PvdO family nonheme iron enzyme [Verrucomicrobia bacterium]|nr:SUMF1/EgtB/PvdO family nonheme iron enzyme [Verrucomicrobiota bacterium]
MKTLALMIVVATACVAAFAGSAERARIASALFDIPLDQIDGPAGANYDYNVYGEPCTVPECMGPCLGYDGGHSGIDIQTKSVAGPQTADENFFAVSRGVVLAGSASSTIAVYDTQNDRTVLYLHARSVAVSPFDQVSVGTLLGVQGDVGAAGEHVHIEVRSGQRTSAACGASSTEDPEPVLIGYLDEFEASPPPNHDVSFFRCLAPSEVEITDLTRDGTLTWVNNDPEGVVLIQRTESVEHDWQDISSVPIAGPIQSSLVVHPDQSTYLVIDLSGGTNASSYPVNYLSSVPAGGWTDEHKTTKLVMRRIPAGMFTMGSPTNELGRYSNETQHQVTLTKDFYIGVFEVTQRQWERVMGTWPSYFTNATYRDSRPVEKVSYYDTRENPANIPINPHWPQSSQVHANSFMGKLRSKTGLGTLDLPTEAQWEYACRAGATTALNSGHNLTNTSSDAAMDQIGRYQYDHPGGYSSSASVNTDGGTAKAAISQPNSWGLYDMHGNVWEWCLDWDGVYPGTVTDPPGAESDSSRISRGGGWSSSARNCRSAHRSSPGPGSRVSDFGLRAAMTLP